MVEAGGEGWLKLAVFGMAEDVDRPNKYACFIDRFLVNYCNAENDLHPS